MKFPKPVPMLQSWYCSKCQRSGEIEFLSNLDCLQTWGRIMQAHRSQDCPFANHVRVRDWRQKPPSE